MNGREPAARARDERLALAALAAAVAASGSLLLLWLGDVTFWRDEWDILLHRRGSDPVVLLEPHLEHIAISLVAVYKGLVEIFGIDSPRPFQVVSTVTFLASVVLMYVYVRRRVGPWLALAPALPILVLGAAPEDLLWPFQLGFFGSMTAGLGALLALERRDRAGDVGACALTLASISFSSLGLSFAAAVAVDVLWGRDRLRRAYIAAVPLALYALWWAGWGHEASSYVSLHNLVTLPSYVLDGFASSAASLLGLSAEAGVVQTSLDWGRPLLVAAVALAIWRLYRAGAVWRRLAVVVALALSFWALAGLNASIFREPFSGRYQYMGAIFVVLIGAEILRGVRPRGLATIAVLAVAGLAALSSVWALHRAWEEDFSVFGRLQRGGLAALELTRGTVDPAFELTEQNSGVDYLGYLDAGSYFSAVDAYGSPAYTPDELAAAAEDARIAADQVLTAALELGLRPAESGASPSCTTLRLGGRESVVEVGPPGVVLSPRGPATARLGIRRYAQTLFPGELGSVGAAAQVLEIPQDRSAEPWELALTGRGTVEVCGLEGA